MKIEVNLEKRYFISLLIVGLMLVGFVGVYAYNSVPANPAIFGHSVDEMNWSNAINANMRINGNLSVNNFSASRICIGTDCRTVWPSEGGSSQWTTLGNDIYYNTGNVNTTNFVKAAGFCIGTNCITSWPSGGSSQWTTSGSDIYYSSGGVGIGGISSADQFYVASTKGGTQNAAIRAVYPNGGGLLNTEFAALAYRNNVWSAVYGKQGAATYAGYFEGNALVTGTLNAGSLCINGVCKTTWPSGGTILPSCSDGSYLKMSGGVWTCVTDLNKYWTNKGDYVVYSYNGYWYVCYNGAWKIVDNNLVCSSSLCSSYATGAACISISGMYSSSVHPPCNSGITAGKKDALTPLYICQ